MPVNPIKKKHDLDKFYTKSEVAKSCIDYLIRVIPDKNIQFIEPSAGAGSFSNQIECDAYDIHPECDYITKLDFLSDDITIDSTTCIFGNPPFGNRNDLTLAFIKRACSYMNVNIIAFILPTVFDKLSMQSVFSSDWGLADKLYLPKNTFLLDCKEYHVPAVFQIWMKKDYHSFTDMREINYGTSCADFSIVSDRNIADIFIFGASPKNVIPVCDVKTTNRGYFLKSNIEVTELRVKIQSVNWQSLGLSSVSGGVAWFTKNEIIKHYRNCHE